MNFDHNAAAFKKFKIPKKVGASGKSVAFPSLPSGATTTTKKLYHKGAATTTSHLKPYLKPRPPKARSNERV